MASHPRDLYPTYHVCLLYPLYNGLVVRAALEGKQREQLVVVNDPFLAIKYDTHQCIHYSFHGMYVGKEAFCTM